MTIGWIVGFVDGEGCFSIGFVKQGDRKEKERTRRGYKTGYQVTHEFAVTQGESSLKSLTALQEFFGVGALYKNRRYDNHKENLYRYVVRKREELLSVIIPFFERYPLRTVKQNNFVLFSQCLRDIAEKKHLTAGGVIRIAKRSQRMNHKRNRSDIIKILRNQTSDKRFKKIV